MRSAVALGALIACTNSLGCELGTTFLGSWQRAASDGEDGSGGASSSGGNGSGGAALEFSEAVLEADLLAGAVRLVAARNRLTLGQSDPAPSDAALELAPFAGESRQMWLFRGTESPLALEHEATGTCLDASAALAPCDDARPFSVFVARERTADAAALFQIRSGDRCLVAADATHALGACDASDSHWYIEPSGWGRRPLVDEDEVTVSLALVVKSLSSAADPAPSLAVPAANVSAVSQSFRECTRIWLEVLTDGRFGFTGSTFESPRPIESIEPSCASSAPPPDELALDVDEFSLSDFEGVVVYWRPSDEAHGALCSEPEGPNGTGLAYVGYREGDDAWMSCTPEPSSVFLQAYLSLAAAHYSDLGVPAPPGGADGSASDDYVAGAFGWNHFRRDYLLGRVLLDDGSYGGLGPRAFALGPMNAP